MMALTFYKKILTLVLFKIFIRKSKISIHVQTTLINKTNYNKINNILYFLLNKTSDQSILKKVNNVIYI